MARAASAGPVACSLIASTKSGIPLRSSCSNCSPVRLSTETVTEEYGFFYSDDSCQKQILMLVLYDIDVDGRISPGPVFATRQWISLDMSSMRDSSEVS